MFAFLESKLLMLEWDQNLVWANNNMSDSHIPLPERLRPRDLTQIIGQEHLLGEHAPLRQMIDQGHLPSIISGDLPESEKLPLPYC